MKSRLNAFGWQVIRTAQGALGLGLVFSALAGPALAAPPLPVPEIDPSSLAGAVTLLTGGMLILTARSRSK